MLPGEAAIIQQLFEAGLEIFHLRKPDADERAIGALLDAIPSMYHDRIALHSFHQLAKEYDIRHLHFTEEHRRETDSARLSQLRDEDYRLSTSVHELSELETLSHYFWYTFFSPVFDSLSKPGYKGFAEDGFYLSQEYKPVPVIALGGIDADNMEKVADMNFDGAAVLGIIWNEPAKAVDNFKLLKKQQELIWRQQFCPKSKKGQS
ncbi:thiamine phosphate synthase [Niastella vici]|uniref:thiamine phosphate synthase n=1 Tax=Niastella vici TaxID=1703345 RepID=UPI001C1FED64|nr:thiamine phosphate synthase [Niastella vici]